MVILYAARHQVPVPALARWLLGLGIAATLTANMAPGLVPRTPRSGDRGLASGQPRRLVRNPGLAHPRLRGDGTSAIGGAPPRYRLALTRKRDVPWQPPNRPPTW